MLSPSTEGMGSGGRFSSPFITAEGSFSSCPLDDERDPDCQDRDVGSEGGAFVRPSLFRVHTRAIAR